MCITRLLQQHIFLTFNMFEPHVVYFEYGNIHLINCTSILHHNHKEDVHVFIIQNKLKLQVKA